MTTQVITIKCIDFSLKYLNSMVKLGEERFGERYTNKDELRAYAENENNICKLAIDIENDKLLGFFLMHGTNITGLSKEFKLTTDEIKKISGNNEKICVAHTLVLQKYVEKFGLATELTKKGLEKAKEMRFHACWSPLWIRKDGSIPAQNVIERNGFTFYKVVHLLWVDDKNYKCIDCNGPCRCDAAIYYKIL